MGRRTTGVARARWLSVRLSEEEYGLYRGLLNQHLGLVRPGDYGQTESGLFRRLLHVLDRS
jgi:hypothetical protein